MTINTTLFKAILSMDSYNRGYDLAIELPTVANSTQIGSATITSQVDLTTGNAQDIGFYALAYDWNGETVISYRGTDYPLKNGNTSLGVSKDVFHGWSLGGGYSAGLLASEQGKMAIDFYNTIVDQKYGTWVQANDPSINITLTGHSLGGGLAGFVGALYDQDATGFDSMAFKLAAQNAYDNTAGFIVYDSGLRDKIYGNSTPWALDFNGISAYSLRGEILYADNGLMMTGISDIEKAIFNFDPSIDLVPDYQSSEFAYFNSLGLAGFTDFFANTMIEAVARHSMSTLVIRMFANYGSSTGTALPTNWENAAKYFWPLMYDSKFAGQIGLDVASLSGENRTKGDHASNLRGIIAYSAIEQEVDSNDNNHVISQTVFGDTGIRAFYHDANALGSAIVPGGKVEQYATEISKTFINFAGLLALHKIEHDDWSAPYVATDGVLTYTPNAFLTINFDNALWTLAGGNAIGGEMPNTIGQAALIGKILTDSGIETTLRATMGTLWGDNSTNIFDKVNFMDSAANAMIAPNILIGSTEASLTIGRMINDIITGSVGNDMISGEAGDDTLKGSRGKDILVGGAGNDKVDYSNVAAFIEVKSNGNDYTVNKYYGTTSATGSYETDYLFGVEDVIGGVGTSGGISFDGAGGKIIEGDQYDNSISQKPINSLDALSLFGRAGNDTLYANYYSNKADYLEGGTGNDKIYGYKGADMYVYNKGDGIDTIVESITSNNELDTLWFKGDISFSDLKFSRGASQFLVTISIAGGGEVNLTEQGMSPVDYIKVGGKIYDMETILVPVIGTANADSLTGTKDNGIYREGSLIHDVIRGGGGNDTIRGDNGNDVLYGEADNDSISGDDGGDYIYGGEGADYLSGDKGDDVIYGENGNDELRGGDGNDIYYGGNDNDYLLDQSNGSNDIYYFSSGADRIYDWGGTDTLVIEGSGTISDITINDLGNDLEIVTGGGTIKIFYADYSNLYKIENIQFSNGSWASLANYTSWVKGTNSSDTLNGTSGSDTIIGYANNDKLYGLAGADKIYGGDGDDTLEGGDGDDLIFGDTGIDIASYATASSSVIVNLDTTTAQDTSGAGKDTLNGIENLIGSSYADTLTGDTNANSIEGGAGDDKLKGHDGNDIIYGGNGNDAIEGNNGDDIIYGGLGNDSLKGSTGVDTFAWTSILEAGDTILDYNKTENEKLDISDILTGYDPLTSLITNFVQITDNGTNSSLTVDVDGAANGVNFVLLATLNATTGMTDEAAQLAAGRLIVV